MVVHQTSIRPPTRVFKQQKIHPSECRSFAYSQEMREQAIDNRLHGEDDIDNPTIVRQRNEGLYPSEQTVDRWMGRVNEHGHALAFRRTGNRRSQREIKNRDLVLLALYRSALPKSTIAEVNAFLFTMNMADPENRFHSYSQIHRAEGSILITKKRSSTTAFQAMDPTNLQKRQNFWNMPYPFGCTDIDPRDMIDLDEAGIYLNETNCKYGKSAVGGRSREVGTYIRERKLNILLAISGDENEGDRWYDLWEEGGTTNEKFFQFIQRIIDDIGPGNEERRRCFTMDNLNSHTSPTVYALIVGSGHRLLFRAPDYPVDGPIEYVFNTLQNLLCLFMREITDLGSLRVKVDELIGAFVFFANYFRHVGFNYE